MDDVKGPSGCAGCGRMERTHGTWFTSTGKHTYQQPTVTQIKHRMVSRRISGGKVMCCEECPPQVSCGSVMCTVRRALWTFPTLHKNRTDVLHYLLCVIGNGYEWVNGQLITDMPPRSDADGIRGVEVDPDDPMFAKYKDRDPEWYAEIVATKEAERAALLAIRENVEDLARAKGAPLTGEVYEESRKYAHIHNIPDDAMPDWRAAADEIGAVVGPVWDARRAERAAVNAAPALADRFRGAIAALERQAAHDGPGPWWQPIIGMLNQEADRLAPMYKHLQRGEANPDLLDMVERILAGNPYPA